MLSSYTRTYRCFHQQTVHDPERTKYLGFPQLSAPVQTKGSAVSVHRQKAPPAPGARLLIAKASPAPHGKPKLLDAVTLNSQKCRRETKGKSHRRIYHLRRSPTRIRHYVSTSEIPTSSPHPSLHRSPLQFSGQSRGFGRALGSSRRPSVPRLQACGRA